MNRSQEFLCPRSDGVFLVETPLKDIPENAFAIGEWQGRPVFVIHEEFSQELMSVSLREILASHLEEPILIASRAAQLISWNRDHQYCGRCGGKMGAKEDEPARECTQCGFLSYPRLSPAVMVRICKDDKILLAKSSHYKGNNYSLIAGFVEAGETLEHAIFREVDEEVGLKIRNIRFFGSQSWPMPHTLLVGFTADYESGEIRPDGEEILEAHWLDPRGIENLPGKGSLARELVDDFIRNYP